MSGHSKWSTIKRQKGANDAKRGQAFTKIANAITIAARLGSSGDAETNPRLRMVLDHARSVNLPRENIQRAIDRGLGKLPGQIVEEVFYEGFGPGKVAYLIESYTDNKMRTTQEIRNIFERSGGSLGTSGVTSYMFDQTGQIVVQAKNRPIEDQVLELIDLGVEEVEDCDQDGQLMLEILCQPQDLSILSTKIVQFGYDILSSTLIYRPNITVNIKDPETYQKVFSLTEKLEEHIDVQKVYANYELSEELN